MGLAPYDEPRYVDLIRDQLLDLKEDGAFRLNMAYFNYATGLTMTHEKFGPVNFPVIKIARRADQANNT